MRKLPRGRRLLAATIGAATIQFVGGCKTDDMHNTVANLMAPPSVSRRVDPQQGTAGFELVANLMIPPQIPRSGTSGLLGGAGVSGTAGSSGAAGVAPAHHADMDAGLEDDAGEA